MNIFYTNPDPKKAAEDLPPHLANKMLIETFQILSNPFKNQLHKMPPNQKGQIRRVSYKNHPCSKWAAESEGNVEFLVKYAESLADRLSSVFQYNISQTSKSFIEYCKNNAPDCPKKEFLPPPECFSGQTPEGQDICSRYKNYLINKPYKKWWKHPDHVPEWVENRSAPKWVSKSS